MDEDRFIREAEVQRITGLSRTTRWRLEREGKFPSRRQLSENAVAWLESCAWHREMAMAYDKRGAIQGNVLMGGGTEAEVIEEYGPADDHKISATGAFYVGMGNPGLRRAKTAIDAKTGPRGRSVVGTDEVYRCLWSAFGKQTAPVGNDEYYP